MVGKFFEVQWLKNGLIFNSLHNGGLLMRDYLTSYFFYGGLSMREVLNSYPHEELAVLQETAQDFLMRLVQIAMRQG
ncbi:MAG: hypothetical protein Q7T40_11465 [Methylobacter sp.]|nr:hypothetical protein [Methylobacter sp.]